MPRLDEGEGKGLLANDIASLPDMACRDGAIERAGSVPSAARRHKANAVVGSDVANAVELSGRHHAVGTAAGW